MGLELGAGGNLELGPVSLKALADLQLTCNDLTAQARAATQAEKDYQVNGPVPVQLRGNGNCATTGSLLISLGGPAPFRMWIVRRLIVQGLTWGTTAAGSCNVHVSASDTPTLGGIDIVDNSTALPNKAFYSGWQVVLVNPQRLIVEIVGGTSAQIYAATGMAEDVPLRSVRVVASE
jgi:hypothetical protein